MALVLDAGGLVAADHRHRRVGALLRVAHRRHLPVRTSSAVVAQVWRDGARQANLARVLAGTDIAPLDGTVYRRIGRLLARTGTADVVDGHIALLIDAGDTVVTSDVAAIRRLLRVREVHANLQRA